MEVENRGFGVVVVGVVVGDNRNSVGGESGGVVDDINVVNVEF